MKIKAAPGIGAHHAVAQVFDCFYVSGVRQRVFIHKLLYLSGLIAVLLTLCGYLLRYLLGIQAVGGGDGVAKHARSHGSGECEQGADAK